MVIVNCEPQECSPSYSDKRENRITKRRNQGIHVSALDRVLRNAQSTSSENVIIENLSELQYAHLFKRTKTVLQSSYNQLKNLGRYLTRSDEYCSHCHEYRQLYERSTEELQPERTKTTNRFSNTFVEKVQNQQRQGNGIELIDDKMPCCTVCKRPRPSIELYCACEEPPKRVVVTGGYRHSRPPPTRYYVAPKKKKQKKWWCCSKKKSDNWNQCYCCQNRMKPTFAYSPCTCPCPPNPSMMQKFKQYMHGKPSGSQDFNMYNAYLENMNCPHHIPPTSCVWCPKGYSIAKADPDFEEYPPRTRKGILHRNECFSSEDFQSAPKDYYSEEEYVDEPGSDSDDCCCCCPCRKKFNTCNVQTDNLENYIEPKTIDTQTERCCAKRRCCRCCRNACGVCNRYHPGHDFRDKGETSQKEKSNKNQGNKRPIFYSRGRNEYNTMKSPPNTTKNSPRSISEHEIRYTNKTKPKTKTIICKTASVQHDPSVSGVNVYSSTTCPKFEDYGFKLQPCHRMQNVMFNTVEPTPLFLDKMFTPYNPLANATKSYNLSSNPLRLNLGSTPMLSTFCHNDDEADTDEISTKTKQRFLNAVCDSILCDLTSKRRNSFSNLLKSPDSGYQEPKQKKSFFSLKTRSSSLKNLKGNKKQSNFSMDHIIKTLKSGRKEDTEKRPSETVINEASKVVRNILEEISSKKDRNSTEWNFDKKDKKNDIIKDDSLRNILLKLKNDGNNYNLEQSRSNSVLLDYESLPGTSTADASANVDDSYTKLMKALDTVRNNNQKTTTK